MIRLEGVSKSYSGRKVLDSISADFGKDSVTSIIGPTGCGKTTLLRIMAGLEKPDFGHCVANGIHISMIFQQHSLFPWRNALSNVMFPLEIGRIGKKEVMGSAMQALDVVGMKGHERKRTYELSGGMQQRVQFARAIVSRPEILLLDEPFSALDEVTRFAMQSLFLEIVRKTGMRSIFVTHNIEEAVFISNRVLVMNFSGIEADIPLVMDHPRDRNSQWYLEAMLGIRSIFNKIILNKEGV